ncbi:MAG: hypothetical protein WB998_11210 [Solirubrobacteraceae bacterium]
MASEAERIRATGSADSAPRRDGDTPPGEQSDRRHFRELLQRPWAIALAVAIPLTVAYLIAAPPAGDLAAATYRSDLFARAGFTTWDTGWYAVHGHWLPAYSLLSPALGALLGVRLLLALSAIVASNLFALIAERVFDIAAARLAAGWFALGVSVSLLSGRVPYQLGFAVGLGAVLALICGRHTWALALAVLTSAASPVAGAFLALAGVAGGLGVVLSQNAGPAGARGLATRSSSFKKVARARRAPPSANNTTRPSAPSCFAFAGAAGAPILILSLAYPEDGYEPFAASAFWPALAGVVLIALLLPRGPLTERGRTTVRVGCALYALALIASYAIHTPMGGNAARLGPLLAGPLLAGVLWEKRRATLLVLAPLLVYWQLATPIRDYASISGDPSVKAAYYAPVLAELRQLTQGKPTIVEVPLTKAHWEAAYLAGHDGVELARGWERQLDTRYAAIFYRPSLSAAAYRSWLLENKVQYVALPDAPLDKAGTLEGAMVARGLPYLRELWRSKHWRVYRFIG